MDECRGDNNTTTKILRYEESPSRYSHALVSSREDREPGSEERSHQDDKDGGDPHTYPAVEVVIRRACRHVVLRVSCKPDVIESETPLLLACTPFTTVYSRSSVATSNPLQTRSAVEHQITVTSTSRESLCQQEEEAWRPAQREEASAA